MDSKLAWAAPGQLVTGWRERSEGWREGWGWGKKRGWQGGMGDLRTELAHGQIAAML